MRIITLTSEILDALKGDTRERLVVACYIGSDDILVQNLREIANDYEGSDCDTNTEILRWYLKDRSGNSFEVLLLHEGTICQCSNVFL